MEGRSAETAVGVEGDGAHVQVKNIVRKRIPDKGGAAQARGIAVRNAIRTALIVLIGMPFELGIAAEDSLGKWEDDGGRNVYEFLSNNQFRFSGLKKTWINYPKGPLGIPAYRSGEGWARGRYMNEPLTLSGAWETGNNICTATDPEGGKVTGNLKIYAGSIECCMDAKQLGQTLVLRALVGTGEGPSELCVNRALQRSVRPEEPK